MLVPVVDDKDEDRDGFCNGDEQGRTGYDDKLTVFEESLRWPATYSCSIHYTVQFRQYTQYTQCSVHNHMHSVELST